MKKSILLVATAIGMLTTSCNKDIINQQEDLTQTPITISATYDAGGEKVAYTEDGANITAKWEADDELIVCWNNHKNTLTLSSGAGTTSATFTGTITGTPSANSTLVCFVKDSKNPGAVTISDNGDYLYTSDAFLTQDGSMDSAASRNLYYGTCFYGDGTNISCTFNVNTSMMKFKVYAPAGISEGTTGATLTYKSGSTELAKATFTVGTDGINTIYLTIPAGHYTGEQTLVYHSGDITETETLSSTQANFVAGQTYSKTLLFSNTPVVDPLEEPLTFETSSSVTITFTPGLGMTLPLEYSTDDGVTWSTYTEPISLSNSRRKVSFRGNNTAYCNSDYINYDDESRFSFSTNEVYVYGNIMSLIDSTDYATLTTMTAENKYAFRGLFRNSEYAINFLPSKKLILPATTLAEGCYIEMFADCAGLSSAPELPATTLADECYARMFMGCWNLISAPELPATTLADGCYAAMFRDCIGLISAPELPATTLADECYSNMFSGCTGLTSAPELPATTMAESCYYSMFSGCSQLSSAPEMLPATSLAKSCYYLMFSGCSILSSAPELPATTLTEQCYTGMFVNCSGLSLAPELPATTLAKACYSSMFSNCSRLSSAPELPATTLADSCYICMFYNCSMLSSAPELPATTMVSQCYESMFCGCSRLNRVKCLATSGIFGNCGNWLYGVASSGTFIKDADAYWETGSSGIPSGWTVQEQ